MNCSPSLSKLFGTEAEIRGEQIKQNLSLYLNTAREAEIRGEQIKQNLSLYLNAAREAEIRGEQIKQKRRRAQQPTTE